MSSTWGNSVKISIFGESHGKAIGVVIDGLPPGEEIDFNKIYHQLKRRSPGNNSISSKRNEADVPEFLSGILENHTTGTPLCAIIKNTDTQRSDYKNIESILRPGHADFTGKIKYKGFNDIRGGGHFSGRLTAPLTLAGAICSQILSRRGINIFAHIYSIHNIKDNPFSSIHIDKSIAKSLTQSSFPLIDKTKEGSMKNLIEEAKNSSDSVGGIIECAITGLKAGIGSPIFGGIENQISSIIFGIPAVKGIEFGNGFECTHLKGSENNDAFTIENENIRTVTNNHGGILGGISSGMPIIFRTAIKPIPSITKKQQTVDISKKTLTTLSIKGRHDPCIVPRAVPVIEAATAIAIINLIMEDNTI